MAESPVKIKRNHRILYISNYLTERPNKLISLSYFVEYFGSAKSSISEDIDFIREVFAFNKIGQISTVAGVAGGVIFYPQVAQIETDQLLAEIEEKLQTGKRIMPGNYIYLADILQEAETLNLIARHIASFYQEEEIDAVMTIETKGIGLTVAVARYLNVPHVIVRRDSAEAEGSTISINYISGSHQTVKKMELTKSSLKAGSKVLIIDDFLRNGGTVSGLISLLDEFDCQPAGVCVFAENTHKERVHIENYVSFLKIEIVYNKDAGHFELQMLPGNFFDGK
ncbi:pur operon repressor [Fundicoccus sp. Sow4_D5]|uniref:pur operon repressor n=1 Tax=Fundicoccus sp. Sow4_D5 TaxID=3438782 RepID=UPI003F9326AD